MEKHINIYENNTKYRYKYDKCRLETESFILRMLIYYTKEISNTIYDRWFTRNTLIPVGKWTTDFMERVFDDDRKNEALLSFYNDYINKVLFSGSYFKVIDISAEDRFDEE